jgi:hypothetical protein
MKSGCRRLERRNRYIDHIQAKFDQLAAKNASEFAFVMQPLKLVGAGAIRQGCGG